jgi:hypothetical protein
LDLLKESVSTESRVINEVVLGTSVNRDAKGYISYPLEDQEDVSVVLEILGRNYDRAKAAAERRGSQDAKE